MSALRPAVRPRRFWIKLAAAAVLAVAALVDWTQPPQRQVSVFLYERAVIAPYRWTLRPFISAFVRCRYRPSCSQYSLDAMRGQGFPKGAWLTVSRLVRCMPWVPLGTRDPAPPAAASFERGGGGDTGGRLSYAARP